MKEKVDKGPFQMAGSFVGFFVGISLGIMMSFDVIYFVDSLSLKRMGILEFLVREHRFVAFIIILLVVVYLFMSLFGVFGKLIDKVLDFLKEVENSR